MFLIYNNPYVENVSLQSPNPVPFFADSELKEQSSPFLEES